LIIAFCFVTRKGRYVFLSFKGFRPNRDILGDISRIGVPAMIERIVMRVGMIAYAKMIASLGTVMLATHQIGTNIMQLSFIGIEACQVSATSLIGQSLGKKRADMANLYSSRCRRLGMMLAILTALGFFFFGKAIVALYIDPSDPDRAAVLAMGATITKLLALYQPLQSSQIIVAGVLRGAGDTKTTAIIYTITVMIVRPIVAAINIYIFGWGLIGAWLAMGADQLLRATLMWMRYRSGKWLGAIKLRH
jgi:Na+-driven multidrug efflux pump